MYCIKFCAMQWWCLSAPSGGCILYGRYWNTPEMWTPLYIAIIRMKGVYIYYHHPTVYTCPKAQGL